jgi:hypothetical protein
MTLASALVAAGLADERVTQLLDNAEQLIAMSGATIYARLLEEARAQCVVVASADR